MPELNQWREPVGFTQGDTFNFSRMLERYTGSGGWALLYAMVGQGQNIEFSSTPSGDEHVISVPPAVTKLWLIGDYELQGFAVNQDGTRTTIYLAPFHVI